MVHGSQKTFFFICFAFVTFSSIIFYFNVNHDLAYQTHLELEKSIVDSKHDDLSFLFAARKRPKEILQVADDYPNAHSELFRSTIEIKNGPNEIKNEPKVALFTLIFGEESVNAPWLPLFLKSAATSGVDYFIVGDPAPPMKLPPNVRHIPITYHQLMKRISTKLFDGIELEPMKFAKRSPVFKSLAFKSSHYNYHYKVIDSKPLLGYLFRSEIADYDWWGHVDNDMIMGNVRKFLPPKILNNYDVIPFVPAAKGGTKIGDVFNVPEGQIHVLTWGPFTMYRNVPRVTELFREIPNLVDVFSTIRPFFIDEWGEGFKKDYYKYSMSNMVNQKRREGELKVFHGYIPIKVDSESGFKDFPNSACTFQQEVKSDGTVRSKVTYDHSLGHKNFTKEVTICHFQFGKKDKNIKATLPTSVYLDAAKFLTYDSKNGFRVEVN